MNQPCFTSPVIGTLDNDVSIDADFTPQAGQTAPYTLIYQGTIEPANLQPPDTVDVGIAIAATSFGKPWVYYKMDTYDDEKDEVPDSIGGRNLQYRDGVPPTVVPGKIGNAYSMNWCDFYRENADMRGFTGDFTVRFWYRYDSIEQYHCPLDWRDNQDNEWSIWTVGDLYGQWNHIIFSISSTDNQYSEVWSREVTLDEWHLVTAYRRGDEIGIRVDHGSPVTEPFSGNSTPGSASTFYVDGEYSPWCRTLDELAIWKDYAFNDADFNADWNTEAGRTWPW